MGLLGTLKEALTAPTSNRRGERSQQSAGAYWCNDCGERIPDVDVEGETPPACPECGDPMAFERSPDSGACAC